MVFDLEKARKIVGAMSPTPWIVLEDRYGQIDVIRNPNHPMHKEGVIELWGMTSETATPDAIGISYMRSEFPNALDEIERLRGFETAARDLNNDLTRIAGERDDLAARIDELEADNQNLVTLNKSLMNNDWILRDNNRKYRKRAQKAELLNKELKADLERSERVVEARLDVIDQQAAKIRELEDVHKRSGMKYAKIINELRSSVYANIPGLKKQWDEILNTPANGKIGPDTEPANIQALQRVMRKQHDHPAEMVELNADHQYQPEAPRSWQITEERKAAIRDAEIALRDAVLDSNDPHCWDAETAVLRGMLEEADHDKP